MGAKQVETLVPILDAPCPDPGLGFPAYAEVLAAMIRNAKPFQMTIGVFGGYGSGKTTMMNAIARALKSDVEAGSLVTIGFNAWRHDHEEHLFLPLLSAVYQSVKGVPELSDCVAGAVWGFIQGLSLKLSRVELSVSQVAESVKKVFAQTNLSPALDGYVDVYDRLAQLPSKDKGCHRIVLFIDDLDRCVPQKALALLEGIKSFMDMEGFVFVLGLDPRAVRTYLSRKYDDGFCVTAEEYLQKMVQIPLHLPRVPHEDVARHLSEKSEWAKTVLQESAELSRFLPCNLRQAKRVLNMHMAIMATKAKLVEGGIGGTEEFNAKVLLALLIVESRWPLAYYALHFYRDKFNNIYKWCTGNNTSRVPKELLGKENVLAQLRNDEFGSVYKVMYKELGSLKRVHEYLDLMGWPTTGESDVSFEIAGTPVAASEQPKPVSYSIKIQRDADVEEKDE